MAAKTALQTLSLLCIILITFKTVAVQSQECQNIEHTIAIGEDLRNIALQCDIDLHHEVRIFKAEYRVQIDAKYALRDNERDNYSCFIRGLTTEVKDKCHRHPDCFFSREDFEYYDELSADTYPYRCDEFKGLRYLMITWQCRAKLNKDFNAFAHPLEDPDTHNITFAVIDSSPLWRWTLNYCHPLLNLDCSKPAHEIRDENLITESNTGCSFVIPANTELWVYAHEVYKHPPENDPDYYIDRCSQRIQFWNDENRWEMCEMGEFFSLPCQDTEHTLYLEYENDDPNVRIGFALYVEVDYLAEKMMSTCGIPVNQLPARPNVDPSSVTTTTTTTTIAPMRTQAPTTEAPAKPKRSNSFEFFDDIPAWIIVLLAVMFSIIIMLIVISIVCFRHCCGGGKDKRSQDDEDDLARSESDWGSEVSTVYVEGDKSSKLVVNSLKASSRSQGELPFTY